jgi:hypothetical protein
MGARWDNRRMHDEQDSTELYREITRETMRRFDASIRGFTREMAALETELAAEFATQRGDNRALTQALLRKLDRLDNGGTAAAG